MLFSSATFLFYFFPLFLALYYLLPWKNTVLLVASLVFYAWGEPRFVVLLLCSALLNYGMGRLIARARSRAWLIAGVSANLGVLVYYKYLGFLFASFNRLLPTHAIDVPAIVLPLGISFFTFQGISYLVDVYRGEVKAQSSFWRFAMYKAMFPQLIAGPIVRYQQIAADIDQRDIRADRIWQGLRQFILGLAQKVLLANTVAQAADHIFAANLQQLPAATAWLGLLCYSLQILYDFAGYSNMAIGIGHMIGFRYPDNFNHPYRARSMTDFWRRWHISLSSWFRDYVYIPLGGNRCGAGRTLVNLALVFILCGFWHGAAWTFLAWGLWHGGFLILERQGLERLMAGWPPVVRQGYTLLAVMLGWVWFRADTLPHAVQYGLALFGRSQSGPLSYAWQMDIHPDQWLALLVGTLCAVLPLPAWPRPVQWLACAFGLLLCMGSLATGTYNPFIYFHF